VYSEKKNDTHLLAMKNQLHRKKVETLLLMKELAEKCLLMFGFLLSGLNLFSN